MPRFSCKHARIIWKACRVDALPRHVKYTGKIGLQQRNICPTVLLASRTSQLAHDFRAVDEEEERPGLIRHRARNQRLACEAPASREHAVDPTVLYSLTGHWNWARRLHCQAAGRLERTRAGRPIEQDALGRLDADRFEELRVPQRQLHQLPDLRAQYILVGHT